MPDPFTVPTAVPGAGPDSPSALESGCVLAFGILLDDEEIHLSPIKMGKPHSVTLNRSDTPPGCSFFGTLHSHPLDDHFRVGTPNSDEDFLIFKVNEELKVQIVATGVYRPTGVSDVYLLLRTTESSTEFEEGFYKAMFQNHYSKLLGANPARFPEEGKTIASWAAGEAAKFATWELAKKLRFGLYHCFGSDSVNRIDNKDFTVVFPTSFRRF